MRSGWTGVYGSWVFGRRVIWAVGRRDQSLVEVRCDLGFVGVLMLELFLSLCVCASVRLCVCESLLSLCVSGNGLRRSIFEISLKPKQTQPKSK